MREKIRELTQPSVYKWLIRVTWNWCEISLIFITIGYFDFWVIDLLGLLLLGTRQHALAILAHDAIHKTISRKKWINDGLGNLLSSLPLFQSLGFFKTFHLNHHAHMLSEKDPEVHIRSATPAKWSTPMSHSHRWKMLLIDLTGWGYLDTRHALPQIIPYLSYFDVYAPILYWGVMISIFIKLNLGWVLGYWTISFVTSYWAMFRMRAITEHIGSDDTHRIKANPLQRFFYLPHNTWYHFEHHQNANVPCWNLPKLREVLETSSIKTVDQLYQELAQNNQ
jgi:fatty acid desaturase